MSVGNAANPIKGKTNAPVMLKALCRRDKCNNLSNSFSMRGNRMPELNMEPRPDPLLRNRPAIAGVMVIARTNETTSIMITDQAIEPTKSPAGPGNKAIGIKARTVVIVDASKGAHNRLTDSPTALTACMPSSSRRLISSDITMAASTSKPRATISPVTDICCIGRPTKFIMDMEISVASGIIVATTAAARQPRVTNSTSTTRPTPMPRLSPRD